MGLMEYFEILNLRRLEAFEKLRDEVTKENDLWDRFSRGNDMLATVENIISQKEHCRAAFDDYENAHQAMCDADFFR